MAEFVQLTQSLKSNAKQCAFSAYDFLTTMANWFLPAGNAKVGTWTTPGDSLVDGDYVVLESPTTGPARQQLRIKLKQPSTEPDHLELTQAPWVGTAGGWNQGGATFDAPTSGPAKHYVNKGATKFTCIASDRVILLASWWTPTGGALTSITFTNSTRKIARASGSWLTDGYVPGMLLTVSGTTSNNKTFVIETISDTGLELTTSTTPVPTNEGPGNATMTPLEVARLSYAGRFASFEIATHSDPAQVKDARPHALWSGIWGLGYEQDAYTATGLEAFGMRQAWKRIHSNTGSGYVNLTSGYVAIPERGTGLSGPLKVQPAWTGNYVFLPAQLFFDEVVTIQRKENAAKWLDGAYLTEVSQMKKWMGDGKLMARDGVAIVWPSASEVML